MIPIRIIPCLQLVNDSLVKTVKFDQYSYIGDPINTVRIFNELEVDELCFLDIRATEQKRGPNLALLHQIANECFMPLSYGGGVSDFQTAQQILSIGFEKIILNTQAYLNPDLIKKLSEHFGNQAVVGSLDFKKNIWGKHKVYIQDGKQKTDVDPVAWAQKLEALGVGEILATSMDKDGTWSGFDVDPLKKIAQAVSVPVIANGGAGSIDDIGHVVKSAGLSAVALGSMVVFQKKGMGVLVNFPDKKKLAEAIR